MLLIDNCTLSVTIPIHSNVHVLSMLVLLSTAIVPRYGLLLRLYNMINNVMPITTTTTSNIMNAVISLNIETIASTSTTN